MDALSELLSLVRLREAAFFHVDFGAPWRIETPGASGLSPGRLEPRNERLVMFHLLLEGECEVTLPGEPPVPVRAGDVIVCPHGDAHEMASDGFAGPRVRVDLEVLLRKPRGRLAFGGDGARAEFICGYLTCDVRLCRAVFAALPRMWRVGLRGDAGCEWLEGSIRRAAQQAVSPQPGAQGVLTRLSEVLFMETVRRYMARLAPGQTGWLAGLRDPATGNALAHIHQRPQHPWTVERLAREANVSRSVLAARFTHFVGEPPMNYLWRLRMALAADLLREGAHTVTRVAEQVGYETDAAFNRAFRRAFGQPPAQWRRAQLAGRTPSGVFPA